MAAQVACAMPVCVHILARARTLLDSVSSSITVILHLHFESFECSAPYTNVLEAGT